MTTKNAKTRFSDRVDNYIKYRPGYPDAVFEELSSRNLLGPESIVADIGSGTGISTVGLLPRAKRVFAVEPNPEMRAAAERRLSVNSNFESLSSSAEETGLDSDTVDLVFAGQAFHWFDREKARFEFKRILKPNGLVALAWNERLIDTTPFLVDYEKLLAKFANDYQKVNHKNTDNSVIKTFFTPGEVDLVSFPNYQKFDSAGLLGRAVSSSYMPNEGDEVYPRMVEEFAEIFESHQNEGFVKIEYLTKLYLGRFAQI